ncbi:MAG: outer membrane lipoprotein carrier protein LolA [Polyangiales bacterium]
MKLALLALLLVPSIAAAQVAAPAPAATLAKVEATYAKATAMAGEFTQITLNTTFGTTEMSHGTFEVAKPDKLRFDYVNKKQKPDKSFVFDGTTLWLEQPMNRRVTKTAASTSTLPSAIGFLASPGQLAKDFTIGAPANKSHLVAGKVVLELTPKQPSAAYKMIQLVVDPTTWTVPRSIVYAPSGDSVTYELVRVNLDAKLAADRFAYVVPKGYELVTVGAKPAPAPPAKKPKKP